MFGFFCVLKNDSSFCISLFFLLHLLNSVSLFYSPFLTYQKKKNVVVAGKWENCLLFSVSVLLVSKTFLCAKKSVFYFSSIFELLLLILLSLHFKPQKNSAKNSSFLFLFRPFFCFTWFLSTFSFITFFFVHFLHLFVHLFLDLFLDKSFKKCHKFSVYHFGKKKTMFFLSFIILCCFFFMHDLQKHFAIFLCCQILFWKYLVSFVVIPLFLFKIFSLKKKKVTLIVFFFIFLLNLFSLFCVVSLCLLSLLFVFLFSTLLFFFILCFSFHVSSPCVCLSLSFMLLLFIPFKNDHLYSFGFLFNFFRSSLLAKLFLFYLICCFAPFSHLLFFFNRVLSNKRN